MYMLGTHIIATYSNMSYTSFVQERIFDPLNMSSTTYSANKANERGRATQSWTPFGRRIPVWFGEDNIMLNAGPGGVISCVEDLVSYIFLPLDHTCFSHYVTWVAGEVGPHAPQLGRRPSDE